MNRNGVVRGLRSPWLPALVLVLAASDRWGHAEDDRVVDVVSEPNAPQVMQQAGRFDFVAHFDNSVFPHHGGRIIGGTLVFQGGRNVSWGRAGDASTSPAMNWARREALNRLARIGHAVDLSDEKREKIVLAMESDIRRFVEEVDEVRGKYAAVRVGLNDAKGQEVFQGLQQDIQRCQAARQRLFEGGSLFESVLGGMLDEEEKAVLAAEAAARRECVWRALVSSVLVKLDNAVGLQQRQHEEIERLLLEHPAALAGDAPDRLAQNPHVGRMLVYMQLAEVGEKRLKPVLGERQWRTFFRLMHQGTGARGWLQQNGIIEASNR